MTVAESAMPSSPPHESDRLRLEVARLTSALAHSEARYRTLMENIPDIVFVLDADGQLTHVAGNTLGIAGYTIEEVMAAPLPARLPSLHPDDAPCIQQTLARVRSSLAPTHLRVRMKDKAGEYRWVEAAIFPLCDAQEQWQGYQGILRDISDRVRAEQMIESLNVAAQVVQGSSFSVEGVLQAVSDQLHRLFHMAGILLLDETHHHLCLTRICGPEHALRSMAELAGGTLSGLSMPVTQVEVYARAVQRREIVRFPWGDGLLRQLLPPGLHPIIPRISAQLPPIESVAAPLIVDDQVLGLLVLGAETLDEHTLSAIAAFANQTAVAIRNAHLMAQLRDSEAQYRSIFQAATNGFLVISPAGTIVEANLAACAIYGYPYERIIGLPLARLVGDEAAASWQAQMDHLIEQCSARVQGTHLRQDGSPLEVEVQGARFDCGGQRRLLLAVTDVTERVRAQEALVRAEKLRALGQMAGGIAHDFNNILVSIRGYADLAALDLCEQPALVAKDLEQIILGANDAAEAVRRLQSLYRQGDDTSDFVPVRLDRLVTEALALTQPQWKDQPQARGVSVRVSSELMARPLVHGNPSELRRVLTNLILNALDAMAEGGSLTVRARVEPLWGLIEVCDTGVGISQDEQRRLFEPFYSVKRETGSGLGLAVSLSIVQRHGGTIEVESAPGQGAIFVVRLPLVDESAAISVARPAQVSAGAERQAARNNRLHVLVVDDEPTVRRLLGRLLERRGHEVTLVESGSKALRALEAQPFDLLVTDLGMPEISGREVTRRARQIYPRLPTILATGWGETISPEQLSEIGATALLAKPFTQADLAAALERAMSDHLAPDSAA